MPGAACFNAISRLPTYCWTSISPPRCGPCHGYGGCSAYLPRLPASHSHLQIGDFGLSCLIPRPGESPAKHCGTATHMDPYAQYASCEVSSADSLATACAYVIYLNVSTPSPTQTDVFAYGVLLWEIATRGGGKFYCMYANLQAVSWRLSVSRCSSVRSSSASASDTPPMPPVSFTSH